jgi:uncharacterized cofD-like protein
MRSSIKDIEDSLASLASHSTSPLDLLPYQDLEEKLIYLELQGPPAGLPQEIKGELRKLGDALSQLETDAVKMVVLGGGTGLSNIIGGDSRKQNWPNAPFKGLKEVFPHTRAVVCVTDDGGSTGELLKDLPIIALGDLRHVLLSSIKKKNLADSYSLTEPESLELANTLHGLFNSRFTHIPESLKKLITSADFDLGILPEPLYQYIYDLLEALFRQQSLTKVLSRENHCLGNLLLAAAILKEAEDSQIGQDSQAALQIPTSQVVRGIERLSKMLALEKEAVQPCTLTPGVLQLLYSNGALVTGEYKSSYARRGYPVDRLFVRFVEQPVVTSEVMDSLKSADVIVLAPGSLYTSTIPIFQVPGLADAIRDNQKALKILVANLWVQKGETDVVREDPRRRFYVSDLIKAYHRNIPGGVGGLFHQVLSLGMQEIPGSILQSYAMEEKVPILLDKGNVARMGFKPLEATIYSQTDLTENKVIHHDPNMLARAIRTLWAVNLLGAKSQLVRYSDPNVLKKLPASYDMDQPLVQKEPQFSCQRYREIKKRLAHIPVSIEGKRDEGYAKQLNTLMADILWYHQDIMTSHLDNIEYMSILNRDDWKRSQEWDNVYSFYDPLDCSIKICQDVMADARRFEQAFLVALGQALLGNYAASKEMVSVEQQDEQVGKMFRLIIRPPLDCNSFFTETELAEYLHLTRMMRSSTDSLLYTRLINGNEGFTPPGLLFGLIYAWYLDNRFAEHIEYKMSVMRTEISDLIPEQVKIFSRRKELVQFFRRTVFRHDSPIYDE